jgi:Rtf2 RING-finger
MYLVYCLFLTWSSIPTRRELVKEAARNPTTAELKETLKEHLAHRWSSCPLSHKPLRRPVVSDCAGLLYNKDAVLQYLLPSDASLLNKEDCDKVLQGRVKSLKDVTEVLFEVDMDQSANRERWTCPVTSKELGPAVKAVYLVPCGHAYSQEAIREMKAEQCLQCSQPYESDNIVSLFPATEEEKHFLQRRIDSLSERGFTHSLKKASGSSKKRKANKIAKEEQCATEFMAQITNPAKCSEPRSQICTPVPRSATPLSGSSTPKPPIGIKNAATASLTARVLEEENERKKRRLVNGENENLKSLFTKSDDKRKLGDGNFMSRGFSIPAKARYD